jgi:hypothetical protein
MVFPLLKLQFFRGFKRKNRGIVMNRKKWTEQKTEFRLDLS